MNTFRNIADDEFNRAQKRGERATSHNANVRAAERILEGFRTLGEAGEHARDGMNVCDAFGYLIGPDAIEWAIWIRLSPKVTKFKIGDPVRVKHNSIKGSIQYWGMPGKRGMKKCSRKQAIKSGNPQVYLWFHNRDYTEETWEWTSALDIVRW